MPNRFKRKSLTPSEYGQRALIRLLIEKLDAAGYKLQRLCTTMRTYSAYPSADLAFKLLNNGQVNSVVLWFQHEKHHARGGWVQLYPNEDPVNDWGPDDKRFSNICGKTNLR